MQSQLRWNILRRSSATPSRRCFGSAPTPSFRPPVVFVLGGPGSGKGTQCKLLVEHFTQGPARSELPFTLLFRSAGELLRAEQQRFDSGLASKHGALIRSVLSEGGILPGHVTVELLKQEMERASADATAASAHPPLFLIDGFPRTMDNVNEFQKQLGPCRALLFLDCSEGEMRRRMLSRKRADDADGIIEARLRGFRSETLPVLRFFEEAAAAEGASRRFVRRIPGDGAVEEVAAGMRKGFLDAVRFLKACS